MWRALRPNKEDRIAKLEWAPNGGLGRVVMGKVCCFLFSSSCGLINHCSILCGWSTSRGQILRSSSVFFFFSRRINSFLLTPFVSQGARSFTGPDGSSYRWRPSTTNADILVNRLIPLVLFLNLLSRYSSRIRLTKLLLFSVQHGKLVTRSVTSSASFILFVLQAWAQL